MLLSLSSKLVRGPCVLGLIRFTFPASLSAKPKEGLVQLQA